MVPVGFHDFFSGCATIAGALIGLLFVAISVSPEYLKGENTRTDHQVRAGAAFSALINTLVIALFALLPTADPGTVGIILAGVRLGSTVALIIVLAIFFFLFGIARAWQLVGAREFGLVTTMASMIRQAAGNGPHHAGGGRPENAGPPPPEDPGFGHASA